MLQFSWWCLLTALFIVRATLVSLLFSLVYAHVSCCVKVGLSMLCWLQGMPMFHDTPLVVHETHATLFTCYFHSILHQVFCNCTAAWYRFLFFSFMWCNRVHVICTVLLRFRWFLGVYYREFFFFVIMYMQTALLSCIIYMP
jgi:hypothetical protein